MFRLFISAHNKLSRHFSTQKRKVILANKNQIQFNSESSQQKSMNSSKNYQEQFIQGLTFLFHQQQHVKSQVSSLKQYLLFRSNILAGFNLLPDEIKQIKQKLLLLKNQVQSVDIVESLKNKQVCIIIIFTNSLISQSFYTYLTQQKGLLSVYLQSIVIYQQQIKQVKEKKNLYPIIMQLYSSQERLLNSQKKQPNKQWIQLPQCAVCLQKLQQQLTGFDQKYLKSLSIKYKKYSKSMCQTCQIISQKQSPFQKILQKNQIIHCNLCKQKNDIWVCMICGQLGCGRYKNADAFKHFKQSGHIIALDLQSHRIWNYLSDCFSHSLKQKYDLQGQQNFIKFPKIQYENNSIQTSILQGAFWQYCSIFSQQMEKQRVFYEEIRTKQKQKFQQEKNTLEKIIRQMENLRQEKKNNLKRITKNKHKIQKKQIQSKQEAQQQKQKLAQFQQYSKKQIDLSQIQKDEEILKKVNVLNQLETQINQLLLKLSQF